MTASRTSRLVFALLVCAVPGVGCSRGTGDSAPAASPGASTADALAVVAEADRLAAADLWPGFDLRMVPVAVYDGERTLLFRHPAPPEGFREVAERPGVLAYAGRHPSVTANTSTEMNGAWTATLMPPSPDATLLEWAGLLVHEAFHVFQRRHHPGWSANEVELFTYPLDDAALLALRRTETAALRRALGADTEGARACWARVALDTRSRRFGTLPTGASEYERRTELNEGLATYVEQRATGSPEAAVLPAADFAADAVRQRAYATGAAIARILDHLDPHWRSTLAQNDSLPLDSLLDRALAGQEPTGAACDLAPGERDAIEADAVRDVAALRAKRAEQRRSVLERQGWRLVILAEGMPLFPQGFDPLNVHVVGAGEVLHTRFLRLGNAAGSVEVLGREALTQAAGAHPLFNGVRTVIISGLQEEPAVMVEQGSLSVQTEGVRAEWSGATVEREGSVVTVRILAR
jgi:hypothetical protein